MADTETTASSPAGLDSPQRRRKAPDWLLHPYLLLALASLCWSGNHIVGRAVADTVPPFGLSTARWILPALGLLPFAWPHLRRDWPELRAHWKLMVFFAILGGAMFSALQYVALRYTTAVNVSVLNSLIPVYILAASAILFRDPLAPRQVLGITTSLIGVFVIIAQGSLQTISTLSFNWGDLLVVFNMAIWAIYSACLRLRPRIHWLSFTFAIAAVSSVATLPFYVLEHASGFPLQPTLTTALAILYVAAFPSVVALASWNKGVELVGATRAGPFLHFVPLFSTILAILLLGEELRGFHLIGFVFILAGVWVAARRG
jgi:drug/metabolite transporter (DMT)-like permease